MNRLTKVAYFSSLALISVVQLIQGKYLLALILIALLSIAVPIFEKREAKRQFYTALRKLYVCVDLGAFIIERDALVKHALMKSAVKIPYHILTAIEAYYHGQRETVLQDLLTVPHDKAYQFWIESYIAMCDDSRASRLNLESLLHTVPRYFREIAGQRRDVLLLMYKVRSGEKVATDEIEALRERVSANLIVAELSMCLGAQSQVERIRKYYEQAAFNLSKGLKI